MDKFCQFCTRIVQTLLQPLLEHRFLPKFTASRSDLVTESCSLCELLDRYGAMHLNGVDSEVWQNYDTQEVSLLRYRQGSIHGGEEAGRHRRSFTEVFLKRKGTRILRYENRGSELRVPVRVELRLAVWAEPGEFKC